LQIFLSGKKLQKSRFDPGFWQPRQYISLRRIGIVSIKA